MAKSGTCELCGLPDNSYSIEEDGNVFKVCKLCYDGYIAKHGSDSDTASLSSDIDELAELFGAAAENDDKVKTLSPEEMAKLLKPDKKRPSAKATENRQKLNEERKKIDAAVKRAVAAKVEQTLAADTEDITRELLEIKAEIEDEKRRNDELKAERAAADEQAKQTISQDAQAEDNDEAEAPDNATAAPQEQIEPEHVKPEPIHEPVPPIFKLVQEAERASSSGARQTDEPAEKDDRARPEEKDVELDREIKEWYAEQKRIAAIHKAANPTIDDERIKITSPEVELPKDTRPKTNFDVATEVHVGSVRFLHAFKFVLHPVTYAIFAGLAAIAVFTALMIIMTWKEAVISLSSCVGAVTVGALLVWYLKRRLEIDKRTVLLRIRQEQILFESMTSPCYRELKTKYPMIKASAWLMSKLSVILPVAVIIGGTAAGIITAFLVVWWMAAPVIAGAALAAVIVYYMFKMLADVINYKLDIERNQQIAEQTLLDLLEKSKK